MERIHLLNSDSSAMVDRRIVTKLLVTYFQRGQSPELLDLMARMLGLSGTPHPSPSTRILHASTYECAIWFYSQRQSFPYLV